MGRTLSPAAGENAHVRLPDERRDADDFAETTGEAFYRGDLAERIVADAASHGRTDVSGEHAVRADWVDPLISVRYRDLTLHEIPPNGQGQTAADARDVVADDDSRSPRCRWIRSRKSKKKKKKKKLAFADGFRYIADLQWMDGRRAAPARCSEIPRRAAGV